MATLLLRLAGPMQSWGTQSRFRYRDTGLEPSKSGVVGLLCAALGRPRSEAVDDLAYLRMGVRVDREGSLKADYHTVGAGYVAGRLEGALTSFPPKGKADAGVISRRYYLADASFLVGLEGERPLLERLDGAVRAPVWQLFLGRKAFPPSEPVSLPDGVADAPLDEALEGTETESLGDKKRLRFVIDDPEGPEVRNDVPLSFADRIYGSRRVQTLWKEVGR